MRWYIFIALLGLSATRSLAKDQVQVIPDDEKGTGAKRTTVIIPNGLSHTVTCPTVEVPCPAEDKDGKKIVKKQPQLASVESAQYWQPPGDDEEVSDCPSTDVLSQMQNGACKASTCSFKAKDPSKDSTCNQRALMLTYSCSRSTKGPVGCMVVNNMIDDK